MVKLPVTGPYTAKDQRKSDKATKFIGRGSPASSTAKYAVAWGDRANCGEYTDQDTVFVSVEGARHSRLEPDYAELARAAKANVFFITDDRANRLRPYNLGERQIAEYLSTWGYVETQPGIWQRQPHPDLG